MPSLLLQLQQADGTTAPAPQLQYHPDYACLNVAGPSYRLFLSEDRGNVDLFLAERETACRCFINKLFKS